MAALAAGWPLESVWGEEASSYSIWVLGASPNGLRAALPSAAEASCQGVEAVNASQQRNSTMLTDYITALQVRCIDRSMCERVGQDGNCILGQDQKF